MQTDNIKSLADFAAVRSQINNEIALAQKQFTLDAERLKYELMPSSMLSAVANKLYNRALEWVDTWLK